MKILILGASGVVGTAFKTLISNHEADEGIYLDHSNFDITSPDHINRVMDQYCPELVINCVALVGINPCEIDSKKAFDINSTAVYQLAKACEKANAILVQPSSHAVFCGSKDEPYYEDDKTAFTSIYSASKIAAEEFALTLCSKSYVVRLPTIFGLRKNDSMGFVDKMIQFLKEDKRISVAEDKIDSPSYSNDIANAILQLVREKLDFGIYHIANSGAVSYFDFICELKKQMKLGGEVISAQDKDFPALAHKPLKTSLASKKLPPLRSWELALEEYVNEIKGI